MARRDDELGAAPEAGVQDRDPGLYPLSCTAAGDREHRRARGDRAHPGQSGSHLRYAGARAGTGAIGCMGTATAEHAALTAATVRRSPAREEHLRRPHGRGAGHVAPGE